MRIFSRKVVRYFFEISDNWLQDIDANLQPIQKDVFAHTYT